MRGLVRRKKRDWRRGVSLIAILAILSTLLPGSLWTVPGIGDVGKVAEAADPTSFKVANQSGDVLATGYQMRRVTDSLRIVPDNGTFPAGTTYSWTIAGTAVETFGFGTGTTAADLSLTTTGESVPVTAIARGTQRVVTVTASWTDNSGATPVPFSVPYTFSIEVPFSINESLKITNNGVTEAEFMKINSSATRKALVFDMKARADRKSRTDASHTDYVEVKISDKATYEDGLLNLLFSSGVSSGTSMVEWETEDPSKDIIEILEPDTANPAWRIRAKGLGHTKLRVTLKETPEDPGTSDEIDVYVKPKLSMWGEGSSSSDEELMKSLVLDGSEQSYADTSSFSLDNIYISPGTTGSEAQLSNKLVWAIYQQDETGTNWTLIQDSLNVDQTKEYLASEQDPKRLDNSEAKRYYLRNAQAATYRVQFFNKDAYEAKTTIDSSVSGYEPFAFTLKVYSNWGDKDATVSIGGYYDLSKALKLPASYFGTYFEIIKDAEYNTGTRLEDAVTVDGYLLRAVKMGNAHFIVRRKDVSGPAVKYLKKDKYGDYVRDADGNIEEGLIQRKDEVKVVVHVGPALQITTTETTMAVGTTLGLLGIFNTGDTTSTNPDLDWEKKLKNGGDASNYLEIIPKVPKYQSEIVAKAVTPANNPVVVTLYWYSEDGITQSAACEITITNTVQKITLTPSSLVLNPGESKDVLASGAGLTGQEKLIWQSSDEKLFTVETSEGFYTRGVVTALPGAVGSGTLIVLNPDHPEGEAIATIPVTVRSPMTEIWISDKDGGAEIPNHELKLEYTREGIQLYAPYRPEQATSTERVWKISYPFGGSGIATVDANTGYVKFLKADEEHAVRVIVEDATNPSLTAYVDIHVTTTRITAITFTEQEIHMIKGDTYQLEPKITPENPMDKTMVWESLGEAVASVDQKGLVTALAPGETYVEVHAAYNAEIKARVKVIITDRLLSIAFENVTDTVQMGKQINLNVVYNPSENVNKKVTFTSTNPGIATVNDEGVVTGIAVGDVMMIAVSEELGTSGAITCMIHVIEPVIVAEGFDIDPKEMTIKEGQTFEIMPIFTPLDPTDQTVEYTSSDETIATVSVGGIVTGVTASKKPAIITCRYVPTGDVQVCSVTVESAVTLTLSPSSKTIVKGRSFTIKKTVAPAGMNSNAVWKTDNPRVATVSAAGKVKARKVGTCNITCKLVNYKNVTAVCKVKVVKVKTTIKLNKTSIRINIGQKYTLKPTVTSNDTKTPSVTYTAINKKIASVGKSSGRVKGKKVGSTYVVATTTDSRRATAKCRVVVIHRATEVRMAKSYATCYVGTRITLKATVLPKSTSIKKLQWSSSDDTIAKVDQSGKVSALKEGEIYITAKTTDGSNKSDRCFVRVLERVPASSITVAQSKLTVKKGDTAQLSYTILPTDTTDTVKMASDNKRVATVTNGGKITAVGTGVCTVTIMTPGGITSTVEVHVVDLNKSSIRMRQYDTETLVVTGTDDSITWYSANPRVATVENGTVVGRSIGTTVVYAYVDGCTLSCRVQIVSVNS